MPDHPAITVRVLDDPDDEMIRLSQDRDGNMHHIDLLRRDVPRLIEIIEDAKVRAAGIAKATPGS